MKLFLWLDFETTGLDPSYDDIIEAAWFVSHADFTHAVPVTHTAIKLTEYGLDKMVPAVYDMHEKTGLIERATRSDMTAHLVEEIILRDIFLMSNGVDEVPIFLAGSSVHFDRGFIRNYMPILDGRLHYRHFDVTTIKMLFDSAGLESHQDINGTVHKASDDVMYSYKTALHYHNVIKGDSNA